MHRRRPVINKQCITQGRSSSEVMHWRHLAVDVEKRRSGALQLGMLRCKLNWSGGH